MRKLDLGIGTLIFLGFVFVGTGVIWKLKGVNVLEPIGASPLSYIILAIGCFVTAIMIDRFG
ncbi:MAG: hypothetical protein GF408_04470 [Candidatus Omnitrophica bacterium]|nr:hypothetical protein [Candidatus Omnitrophota bacterium]